MWGGVSHHPPASPYLEPFLEPFVSLFSSAEDSSQREGFVEQNSDSTTRDVSALRYVCCLSLCKMCYDAQQIVHCNYCTKVAVPLLQSICRSAIVAVQCGLACANVLQSCFDHIVISRFRSWQISICTKILSLWAPQSFPFFPTFFLSQIHRYILY